MTTTTTFIGTRRLLWLWLCMVAVLGLSGIYLAVEPIGGRSGATRLGICYGLIAAAGIAFLMWYGIRKRYRYKAGSFTLKSWLGPHVWIGVSLAVIVPLHSGFKISWSFHSMCYFLMLLTIASGAWGAYAYLRLPRLMEARREGITIRGCIDQIESAEREMATLAKGKSPAFQAVAAALMVTIKPSFLRLFMGQRFPALVKKQASDLLSSLPAEEYQGGIELIGMAVKRTDVANRMLAEAHAAAKMRVWLYLHLPLSFGCVVAVAAHVFWVLYYRGWHP